MAETFLCPACSAPIPIPVARPGAKEMRSDCPACATEFVLHRPALDASQTDSAVTLGESLQIPGYHIVGVLGRGGMGMVYAAVRQGDRRLVAIKVLPPDCAVHPELVVRFDMEAQLMASLNHPSVVAVLDRGRVGGHYFIVLEYISGRTLKDRIKDAAPLGVDEVLAVSTAVSEAIQACHDNGLIHRDLKPANILLCQTGRVVVTDFGIANLLRNLGENTENGVMIGTPQYVAPEQLKDGSRINTRADQYSLAVIMYEMLTSQLPMGVFEPPSRSCRDVSGEADAALLRALSRDPRKRYDSMRHFMRAFRKTVKKQAGTEAPEDIVRRAATPAPIQQQSLLAFSPAPIRRPDARTPESHPSLPEPVSSSDENPVVLPPFAGTSASRSGNAPLRDLGPSGRAEVRPHWLLPAVLGVVILVLAVALLVLVASREH